MVNFHLYEDDAHEFDVLCLGLPQGELDIPDQAYNEVLLTDDDLFHLKADGCESCLQIVMDYVKQYLSAGTYSSKLSALDTVSIVSVAGNLEVTIQK